MVNFINSIFQRIEDIDYAWEKPESYVVFIPGLSILVQQIQSGNFIANRAMHPDILNVLQMSPAQQKQEADKVNLQSHKCSKWCQWHSRGAIVQMAIALLALQIFKKTPFSVILAGFAIWQFIEN